MRRSAVVTVAAAAASTFAAAALALAAAALAAALVQLNKALRIGSRVPRRPTKATKVSIEGRGL